MSYQPRWAPGLVVAKYNGHGFVRVKVKCKMFSREGPLQRGLPVSLSKVDRRGRLTQFPFVQIHVIQRQRLNTLKLLHHHPQHEQCAFCAHIAASTPMYGHTASSCTSGHSPFLGHPPMVLQPSVLPPPPTLPPATEPPRRCPRHPASSFPSLGNPTGHSREAAAEHTDSSATPAEGADSDEQSLLTIQVKAGSLASIFGDAVFAADARQWLPTPSDGEPPPLKARVKVQVVAPDGRPLLRAPIHEEDAAYRAARQEDMAWLQRQQQATQSAGAAPEGEGSVAAKPNDKSRASQVPDPSPTVLLTIAGTAQCYLALQPDAAHSGGRDSTPPRPRDQVYHHVHRPPTPPRPRPWDPSDWSSSIPTGNAPPPGPAAPLPQRPATPPETNIVWPQRNAGDLFPVPAQQRHVTPPRSNQPWRPHFSDPPQPQHTSQPPFSLTGWPTTAAHGDVLPLPSDSAPPPASNALPTALHEAFNHHQLSVAATAMSGGHTALYTATAPVAAMTLPAATAALLGAADTVTTRLPGAAVSGATAALAAPPGSAFDESACAASAALPAGAADAAIPGLSPGVLGTAPMMVPASGLGAASDPQTAGGLSTAQNALRRRALGTAPPAISTSTTNTAATTPSGGFSHTLTSFHGRQYMGPVSSLQPTGVPSAFQGWHVA